MNHKGIPTLNRGAWDQKTCTVCKQPKPIDEFLPSAIKRSDYRCRLCQAKRAAKRRLSKPEQTRLIAIRGERKYLLKKYGVTPDWYESQLKKQNEKCAICGCNQFEKSDNRFDVDHCHSTGKVRGLLCNRCNTGLGQFRDNLDFLVKAIDYLLLYHPI